MLPGAFRLARCCLTSRCGYVLLTPFTLTLSGRDRRAVFLEPTETRFDLRWRMFGIPVRVHPMFWLVTVIMGQGALQAGVQYLLIWVGCVFVSILVHEMGHALMGMAFGSRSQIVLYSFGGLAIGANQLHKRWQRIAVCAAGPAAGFLFLGLVFGIVWVRNPAMVPTYVMLTKLQLGWPIELPPIRQADNAKPPDDHPAKPAAKDDQADGEAPPEPKDRPEPVGPARREFAVLEVMVVADLIFINLVWGLVNLLPVWPLDGGQISRNVCEGISPDHGLYVSLGVSLVTAGLLCLHCIMAVNGHPLLPLHFGSWYTALLFGLLAWGSLQLLNQMPRREEPEPWEHDDSWRQ